MPIHLNSTVIRNLNDDIQDMEKLIWFANKIGGEAKFVDLASTNTNSIVSCEEIEEKLISVGFRKFDKST